MKKKQIFLLDFSRGFTVRGLKGAVVIEGLG